MTGATPLQQLLELHRRVKFTDVTLGIRDADVCLTCHSHLDEPDDWPDDEDWHYPLVQDAYPCRSRQLLAQLFPFDGPRPVG